MDRKIRVLVVDDSRVMRRIISDIIDADPELEVVGKAKDGAEALEKARELKPDVITLDVHLPDRDGIDVLRELMKRQPTRVIMLSAYTRAGATATMKALQLGAVDFIAKPSGEISLELGKLKSEISAKVKLAAQIDLDKYIASYEPPASAAIEGAKLPGIRKLVVIGASTGGPRAVLDIMKAIPGELPASFLIVQHMPKGFTMSLAERISWHSGIRTKEAEAGDRISPCRALVAPAGSHMKFARQKDEVVVQLTQDPLVNFVRPSIDVTMASAAEVFGGKNIIGVILTGLGRDGTEGTRKIKEKGGQIIVQDEETSVVWGMPRSVVKEGLADIVSPLSHIADEIVRMTLA
jgi:two-component system, chemotaxis family, protein-glutamate methylesterase/glutaminase